MAKSLPKMLFLICVFAVTLSACGEEEKSDPSSGGEAASALAGKRGANQIRVASEFVALAASGNQETCDYLSPQYKKLLSKDLDVSRNQLCETLYPDPAGKIKIQETALLNRTVDRSTTLSAICLLEKTDTPALPEGLSRSQEKRLRRFLEKEAQIETFLGPLIMEIVWSRDSDRWEMNSLPASTALSKKREQEVAKSVLAKVKPKCEEEE